MSDEMILPKHIAKIMELKKKTWLNWDGHFMAVALLITRRSDCGRRRIGCILVSNREHNSYIVLPGYNGLMACVPHNSKVRDSHGQAAVHAEQKALGDAAGGGISISGATACIYDFPCLRSHVNKVSL
jgi:dCMP deaminase